MEKELEGKVSSSGKELQKQVEEQEKPKRKGFGTLEGVFTPTLLTILGVIMFLREGWVVGNAGLLGAWLIISLSFMITTFTGLSLSSITTNIKIGAGGAFSIISQGLGLEIGGSVGVPLYLSQSLAAAMYIFGFRAGWLWIFPEHPALIVDLASFVLLFTIAFISARLAFRTQYLIMAIILGAIVSVVIAAITGSMEHEIVWWGDFPGAPENDFPGTSFWVVFAIFFPASTGIMAGANMSGELKDPRKSIPVGTLSAIGISYVIYMALAYWFMTSANTKELISNYTVMIERAYWGPIVLAGLLGATFSSALSSIVGAPRILQAMGERKILPKSKIFAKKTKSGEPRNAMLVTGVIILGTIFLRDLNIIAPLITMFFLITYLMINVVIFIEQNLKLLSFRPLFRVPKVVSFLGMIGCLFAMFVVNYIFSIIAMAVVLAVYMILLRRNLKAPQGDMRSGLFVSIAEWAAKKMQVLSSSGGRTWKTNILVPVEDIKGINELTGFLHDLTYPKGYIRFLGLADGKKEADKFNEKLPELSQIFREYNVFSSWSVVTTASFNKNLLVGMETLSRSFFRPNIVFLSLSDEEYSNKKITEVVKNAEREEIGVLLFENHSKKELGKKKQISVWLNDRGTDWDLRMDIGNADLALLIGYKLKKNWPDSSLRIGMFVKKEKEVENARKYLKSLIELARMPEATTSVNLGELLSNKTEFPKADLNIFCIDKKSEFKEYSKLVKRADTACLFARDSGRENIFA